MKTKMKKNTGNIRMESVSFAGHGRLNREKGVVKDCKILGMESRHGYKYTAGAMKGAIQLYEGTRVNIDHPERKNPGAARSYRDRFGHFENVRFVEGDGLRGDFHFNPKHSVAEQFMWDVENNPDNCGFSHNASGPLVKRGGNLQCESIEAVRSVDLVADAATTASLFEGKERMKIKNRKPKKLDRATVRRKLIEGFGKKVARQLLENLDPAGQQAAAGAAPSEPSKSGNVDALLALVRQVLEDPNITAEESIKAVSKRLKALKEMIPGGSAKDAAASSGGDAGGEKTGMEGAGDDEDDDEEDTATEDEDGDDEDDLVEGDEAPAKKNKKTPAKNDRSLEARLARLEAREERVAIRELCDEAGFKPTAKQMALLEAAEDEETRNDLIESWTDLEDLPRARKTIRGKTKATSMMEGGHGGKKPAYKSAKEWAAGLV